MEGRGAKPGRYSQKGEGSPGTVQWGQRLLKEAWHVATSQRWDRRTAVRGG